MSQLPVCHRCLLTALPAPHLPISRICGVTVTCLPLPPANLLIRCACSSLEPVDAVYEFQTCTHSLRDFFCLMRVFPARFSPPACSLSTLPVPNLPVEPDSWITGLPFVSDHKLLYLPAPYRPCLFPSNLLHSTPGKLTCWLCRHHPRIDWETRTIREWGASCHSSCLKQAAPPCPAPVINADPPDLTGVLPGCHNQMRVFQALVNDVLWDMLNRFVFVYLDDILIFSKTVEEHVHVCLVLQRLLESSLFVKAEKCEFHSPSVLFLRYIITPGSIQMDSAKISVVLDWPVTPGSSCSGSWDLQTFITTS